MFDSLKKELKSKLIFQFMKNAKKPQYLEVLKFKKEIAMNSNEIEMDFVDLSMNEYKVYDCNAKYIDEIHTNSISIYYNQTNYIQCGDGNHSAEIIFSDFMNKSIKSENCSIEYDGVKYFPIEDFGLLTRKRINFINVDINKFKFPHDINRKEVKINTKDNKNFLISISIIDEPKVIAVYLNNPFIEKKLNITENEILLLLDTSLDSIKKIVYVKEGENYLDYADRGRGKAILNLYVQELKKSYEIEKKISEYFVIPREELNEEQIILYDKYSDFMAYFPDFLKDERNKNNINGLRYYMQFYSTKNTLIKFLKSVPKSLNKSDKIKLKYSACRCLRLLLNKGKCENSIGILDFIDFTQEETIYYDANDFNRQFINYLTEKSEIFLFFLQINSGSGINLLSNEFMSRISMLNEESIKNHLFSTIPKYAIKIHGSPFNACSMTEVKITCINDISIFGPNYSENSHLNISDYTYNKRYLLANLLQHEDFGHLNFSINFYAFYDERIERSPQTHYSENLSPFKYYMINEKKEKIQEIVKETKISILIPKKKDIKEEDKKEEDKLEEHKQENEEDKNKEEKEEGDKNEEDKLEEDKQEDEEDKKEGDKNEEDMPKKDKKGEDKQEEDKQEEDKQEHFKQDGNKTGEDKEEGKKLEEFKEEDKKEENKIIEGQNEEIKKEKDIKEKDKKEEEKEEEDIKEINKKERRKNEEDEKKEFNSLNNNEKKRENDETEKVERKDIKGELGEKKEAEKKENKKSDMKKQKYEEGKEKNKDGKVTSKKYLIRKKNIRIKKKKKEDNYEEKEEVIIKGESGLALSFFLTRGKYKLMKIFRKGGIDFQELFTHPELPAAEDLSEFIDELTEIYRENREYFLCDSDNSVEYKTRFQNSSKSNYLPYGIPRLEKYD